MKLIPNIFLLALILSGCTQSPKTGTIVKQPVPLGDPTGPCETCTNLNNITNVYEPIVYPPGSLLVGIQGTTLTLTNTVANHVYEWQSSPDLIVWSEFDIPFTNSGLYELGISESEPQLFFRVHDVTSFYVTNTVQTGAGNNVCAGPTTNQVSYGLSLATWGYAPNPVTKLHQFSDPANPSTRIEVVGRFGDHHCGTGTVTLVNPPDPYYRATLFNVGPHSSYAAKVSGFVEP